MKKLVLVLLLVVFTGLYCQTVVEWKTNMGDFKAELREDLVPITAYNFRDLANDGFYDGCIFHRVIEDFMIQDGDPTGTGYGGPGYTIPDEFHPDLVHVRGVVSMANAGPNTGGSQYFITVVPTDWLDGVHAIFGHIIEGMDVVDSISVVPTNSSNRPIDPVIIDSIRVLTPPVHDFIPELTENTVDMGHIEVFLMNCTDFGVEYEWYVNEELMTEVSSIYTHTFDEAGDVEIKCIVSGEYDYDYILRWNYEVIDTNSEPNEIINGNTLESYPNPFNPETNIVYNVETSGKVQLEVYNLKGQLIKKLVDEYKESGKYTITWNAEEQASGIYLVRCFSSEDSVFRKLILMK